MSIHTIERDKIKDRGRLVKIQFENTNIKLTRRTVWGIEIFKSEKSLETVTFNLGAVFDPGFVDNTRSYWKLLFLVSVNALSRIV